MDEKTEALRDLFLEVADEETVTESQEESRGSVAGRGESAERRLSEAIAEMHEKFDFETDLSEEQFQQLVRCFYDGDDDETIARELSVSLETVFYARMDVHLVRDEDPPGVSVEERVWDLIRTQEGTGDEVFDETADVDSATVEKIRAVLDAESRSRRVSHRFRTAFEEFLTDADLSTQHVAAAHRDGLGEATEDAEVDVDF